MATKCYAMVRGSAIRVTGLDACGDIGDPIRYAASKSVATVTVDDVTEPGNNEMLRNEIDQPRLLFTRSTKTVRHTVDIEFIRTDPGIFHLVAGMVEVDGFVGGAGFGEGDFGEGGFGGAGAVGVVGYDARTRTPAASFALEVWSRLVGQRCPETGLPQWGYTVFPFLRGGYLSAPSFSGGLVSFTLRSAQSRRVNRWGVGPFDLEGPHQRLLSEVSRNGSFRQMLTTAEPPAQTDGIVTTTDIIEGGSATITTSDVIDGEHVVTSPWIVEGGAA